MHKTEEKYAAMVDSVEHITNGQDTSEEKITALLDLMVDNGYAMAPGEIKAVLNFVTSVGDCLRAGHPPTITVGIVTNAMDSLCAGFAGAGR